MRPFLAATLITAAMAVSGYAGTTAPESQPNFTGKWSLNKKLSDPIQPAHPTGAKQAHGRGHGGMSGGGGGSGGVGHGSGRGGREGGGAGGSSRQQPSARSQQQAARLQRELANLEIFHAGVELDVTNGLDISRLLFTDGRTMTIWTQRGEATATAVWEGQALVVQWKTRQDTTSRTRRYTLADDGNRLTVTEKRRQPQGKKFHEMVLIYDKSD